MTRQTPHMKLPSHEEEYRETAMERSADKLLEDLTWFYLCKTSPLILMQLQFTNIYSVHTGVFSTLTMRHYSEARIIISTMMKQQRVQCRSEAST